MESKLETLVAASQELIAGSGIEEKQKELDDERRKLAEEQRELAAQEGDIGRTQSKLEEEASRVRVEETHVKEMQAKQSAMAADIAERAQLAEEKARREEEREEREDQREKNEAEREKLVENIEKKVEENDLDVIDEKSGAGAQIRLAADSSNATASNSTGTVAVNGTSAKAQYFVNRFLKLSKYRRQRDYVERARDPEENRADNVIDGDIRISRKYLVRQVKRKLRELADMGDLVGK